MQMIVRKYTNYLHQVYYKEHPENPSTSSIIRANLLLKLSTILSPRQVFARDMREDIAVISNQRAIDEGTNEAGTFQLVLKEMWDALTDDERSEWEAKAEDECGDIAA